MAQVVYAFTSNGGDGSSSICFTKDPNLLRVLEDEDPEGFGANEGCATALTFPDGLNLEEAGFSFYEVDNDFDEDEDEDEDLDTL